MDEVPTRAPNFVLSPSVVPDSDLTANLSLALTRGAGEYPLSVESRCPRLKCAEAPLQPTPRCRKAAVIRFRGGDGLRPAGLLLRERDLQQWVLMVLQTSSTAKRSPFRTRHGFARPTRRRP